MMGGCFGQDTDRWRPPSVLAAVAIVLLSGSAATIADDETEELVKEVTRGCKTAGERAEKLLKAARALTESPRFGVGLLEKACEFGLKTKPGYGVVAKALDLLEQLAPQRRGEWDKQRLTLLQRRYVAEKGPARDEIRLALAQLLVRVGDRELEQGRATEAVATYRQALAKAGAAKSTLAGKIREKLKRAQACRKLELLARNLKRRLAAAPEDKETARRLAVLYLVGLNRPREASRYASAAGDTDLKKLADLVARR